MGDTTTFNYGWIKPEPGVSIDWSRKLNNDLDNIDSSLALVAGRNAMTLPSVAALRATTAIGRVEGTRAVTNGYTTAGDGGNATYRWDAASTATDDGGSVINPTGNAGAGRWRLLVNGNVASTQFATTSAMMTSQRTARSVLTLGTALEVLAAPLTPGLNAPLNNVGLILRGSGWNLDAISTSSGFDGTALTTAIFNLDRPYPSAVNNNAPIVFEDFAVVGGAGPKTAGSAQNGLGGSVNSLVARNLLVQYMGGHGLDLNHSYSCNIDGGLYFGNFKNGLNILNAFNNSVVDRVRAYGNGRDFSTTNQSNMFVFGSSSTNYSPVVRDCDVSYSGFAAWSYTGGNLVSINVAAGVATIVTNPAHGLTTGNSISIRHTNGTGLATFYAATVTVVNSTTLTVTTGAANGNYNAATVPAVTIGPSSTGLQYQFNYGGRIEGLYAEDNQGFAAYVGNNNAVSMVGGFVLNGDVLVDTSTGVEIGGIYFQGESRLTTNEINNRATINVKSSNVFGAGASWVRGSYYMVDGQRFGPAIPTTGTWLLGEVLWNSSPTAGSAVGWVCTAGGTPGTFQPFGVVGQVRATAQSNGVNAASAPTQAEFNALVAVVNALMANLRTANVTT